MIQDMLVVDPRDARLSEKLQLDADLTLAKALAQGCQYEAVKISKGSLGVRGSPMSMPFGRKGPLPPTEEILQSRCLSSPPPFQNPNSAQLPCTWCGRAASHGWNAVQRVMQTAISAEVKGHFQIMCRTKRVGMVQVEGDNNVFITTCARCGEESAIDLNTVPVQFKINTGDDVLFRRRISRSEEECIYNPNTGC